MGGTVSAPLGLVFPPHVVWHRCCSFLIVLLYYVVIAAFEIALTNSDSYIE